MSAFVSFQLILKRLFDVVGALMASAPTHDSRTCKRALTKSTCRRPAPDCALAAGTFLISAKEPITKVRGAVADISAPQGRRHKRNLNCGTGWTGRLNVACSNYHRREIK